MKRKGQRSFHPTLGWVSLGALAKREAANGRFLQLCEVGAFVSV